jgi:hypothetical protein
MSPCILNLLAPLLRGRLGPHFDAALLIAGLRRLRQRDRQEAIAELSLRAICVDIIRQFKDALDSAIGALGEQHVTTLTLLALGLLSLGLLALLSVLSFLLPMLIMAFRAHGERVAGQVNFDVLRIDSRKLQDDPVLLVVLDHLGWWDDACGTLLALLATCRGQAEFTEETIHLLLHLVEDIERTAAAKASTASDRTQTGA